MQCKRRAILALGFNAIFCSSVLANELTFSDRQQETIQISNETEATIISFAQLSGNYLKGQLPYSFEKPVANIIIIRNDGKISEIRLATKSAEYGVKSQSSYPMMQDLDVEATIQVYPKLELPKNLSEQDLLVAAGMCRTLHASSFGDKSIDKMLARYEIAQALRMCDNEIALKFPFAYEVKLERDASENRAIKEFPYRTAELQALLRSLGHDVKVDGRFGNKTRGAFLKETANTKCQLASAREIMISDARCLIEMNSVQTTLRRSSEVYESADFLFPIVADNMRVYSTLGFLDVNNDGVNEVFLGSTQYDNFESAPIAVFTYDNGIKEISSTLFNGDIPTCNDCHNIVFDDINGDGLPDLVISEAGRDREPWTGTSIEVAVGSVGGFRRLTKQIENTRWGVRSYATAVGNLDGHTGSEILVSSGTDWRKSFVARVIGDDINFSDNPWVDTGLWRGDHYSNATNLQVADFDDDGKDDLYVGGNIFGPSQTIVYGGFAESRPEILPPPFFGKTTESVPPKGAGLNADITGSAIADLDGDGDLDIVSAAEAIVGQYHHETKSAVSSFSVLEQVSPRQFVDVTSWNLIDAGPRYFIHPIVYDVDQDGRLDIIFNYWDKNIAGDSYGSVMLFNQGGMLFRQERSQDLGFGLGFVVPYGPIDKSKFFVVNPPVRWDALSQSVSVSVVKFEYDRVGIASSVFDSVRLSAEGSNR